MTTEEWIKWFKSTEKDALWEKSVGYIKSDLEYFKEQHSKAMSIMIWYPEEQRYDYLTLSDRTSGKTPESITDYLRKNNSVYFKLKNE